MICALPFYKNDKDQAIRLAQWIAELGEVSEFDCLLVVDRNTDATGVIEPLQKAFRKVTVFVPDESPERRGGKMPNAVPANAMFRQTAWRVFYFEKEPFFWLEPDAIPLRSTWLKEIAAEYATCGKAFMGAKTNPCGVEYMPGVAAYPAAVCEYSETAMRSENTPWDLNAANDMLKNGAWTPLVQHHYGEPQETALRFPDLQSLEQLSPDAAVFHQNKDGTLIERLRERHSGATFRVLVPGPFEAEVVQKPWKDLTKHEKKKRRQAQAAKARAAKEAKKNPPKAMPAHVSESDTCRDVLARFCVGLGLDVGFGGSAINSTALTFDMAHPYTKVGGDRQILRGNAGTLNFICDGVLDYIFSSHLLEDFTYYELETVIAEWRRVLKPGGLLVTNCPDQRKFLAHCAATGQGVNDAHKEADFSLTTFRKVLDKVGPWETVFEEPNHGPYSFLLVVKRV